MVISAMEKILSAEKTYMSGGWEQNGLLKRVI